VAHPCRRIDSKCTAAKRLIGAHHGVYCQTRFSHPERFPSVSAKPAVSAEKAQNRKTTKHPETLPVNTGQARRQCRKNTKPQNDKAS
jgi:hypothetical protein